MGGMLRSSGYFITNLVACLSNVFWHAKVNHLFLIVPLKVDFQKYFSVPINCKFVGFRQVGDEVTCDVAAGVFYAKAVNNKTKIYRSCFMFKEARSSAGGDVATGDQVFD